jgi:hypothetical protein
MSFFYLFSFTKAENGMVEQVLPRREGWHQWEGEAMGKGGRRVTLIQKMCTHASKFKTIPGIGGGGIKESGGRDGFKYDVGNIL